MGSPEGRQCTVIQTRVGRWPSSGTDLNVCKKPHVTGCAGTGVGRHGGPVNGNIPSSAGSWTGTRAAPRVWEEEILCLPGEGISGRQNQGLFLGVTRRTYKGRK